MITDYVYPNNKSDCDFVCESIRKEIALPVCLAVDLQGDDS